MKRALLAGLLTVVAVTGVLVYTGVTRDREYRRLIAEGDRALGAEQTFVAIEAFSGAIALKGDSMLAHLRRGETYRRRGDLTAALRDLRTAARLDPTATRPLEQLGDTNYALRQYANAEQRYAEYLRLDDRTPRVLYKLALVRYRNGSSAAAIPLLDRAVELDDQFTDAHYLLGLGLRAQDRSDAAIAALRQAVELAPGAIEAREELADLHGSLGQTDEQIDQLEALAALDPSSSDRQIALSLAYALANRTDLAVLTLGRTAERYPEAPQVYVALGRIWLNIAERRDDRVALGKALEALDASTVAAVASSEALTLRGRALLLSGDAEEAERVFARATESFPVSPAAYRHLSALAERRGHLAVARGALVTYQALVGDDGDSSLPIADAIHIGDLAMRTNQPDLAAEWFQRAADLAEPDVRLLRRLADAYWRAGDLDAARATVSLGLHQAPRNRALLALQARIK